MASDDSVVVSAPSVEEAIIIGLTRLTATRDEVDIEVLDEGNKGFLGIGSRVAQVRLTRRPREADAAASTPLLQPAAASEPEPIAKAEEEPAVPAQSSPTTPSSATSTSTEVQEEETVAAPEVKPEKVAPAVSQPRAAEPKRRPQPPESQPTPRVSEGLDRAALEAVAREIIDNLLQGLSVETTIEWIDEDRPTLWVAVGGKDADALVGPRARNLHSLQYLFRALIYHKIDGNYNVVVDADGYRRRRRRSLESMAQKRANQAVEQGQTVRLRAMPAHERRIIHIALREDDRVTTESVGRGRDRAVTIVPVRTDASRDGS